MQKIQKNGDFDYKAGVALIDLGFVRFSRDIRTYDFISDSTISVFGKDYQNLTSIDGLQGLSDVFYSKCNWPEKGIDHRQ
jgi:hypothetical protein